MQNIVAIIPTYNRKEKLSLILSQLQNQKLLRGIKLEIVVVIDGSTDGTLELLQDKFQSVYTVFGNGKWWYTKSMNEGFKFAQKLNPDYILTLNDDVEISSFYIKTLTNDFNSLIEQNCILGSFSVTNDSRKLILFGGIKSYKRSGMKSIPYFPSFKIKLSNNISGIHQTQELPGRGILIPNKILLKLNFFDPIFPQYGSDTDFCFRARKAGINVLISWNSMVKVNTELTRIRINTKNDSFKLFLKDMFNKYSHHSIRKFILFQTRHYHLLNIIWKLPYYLLGNLWHFIKYEPLPTNYENTKVEK